MDVKKMREILFRGKRIDNDEWVEGKPLANNLIVPVNQEFKVKVGCIYGYEIIPETVGQYTGLCDRNGGKIFEGNILEAFNGNKGYVVFKNDAFMKSCNPKDMPYLIANDVNAVIGNIHDNPELLEVNQGEENDGKIDKA